jgi:multimeric flavodoxin WrbA
MKVLGIVGSPRRDRGLTHEVVSRILAGAEKADAQTEMLYLADENPVPCVHCGHPCFSDGVCAKEDTATDRSMRIESFDAIILGAPVYCWQPNALTCALFDKFRLTSGAWSRGPANGRYALGVAVAGGTGTGVFPALQSIYSWLCIWQYVPLKPLPVTRFNYQRALQEAPELGSELANAKQEPFRETADLMVAYDELPFMSYSHVDEFHWLA